MGDLIGTQVNVPGTRGKAILRYYGPIRGKQGTFAGLELLGPIALTRGKNSGDVDGVQYFEVQSPASGLFLPLERLKTANPQLDLTAEMLSRPNSSLSNSSMATRPPSFDARSPATLSIAKRGEKPKFGSPSLRSLSYGERRPSEDSSRRPSNQSVLESELVEMRQKYEKSEREMSEKLSILNELKSTVDDLQPILKQYEAELSEKDTKIYKLKTDFDAAREEWRTNLDIMVHTYEENENFYESKIKQLQMKVGQKAVPVESPDLVKQLEQLKDDKLDTEGKLSSKIISLEATIKDLETQLDGVAPQDSATEAKIVEYEKEIDRLKSEIDHNLVSKDLQAELRAKSEENVRLERLVQEYEQKSVNKENESPGDNVASKELNRQVESLKLENDKLIGEIISYKEDLAKISTEKCELLKQQEDAKNNGFEPNGDSTGLQRVKELEEDLFYKGQEIKALEQQLEKANSTVATQKQHIKQLETKTPQEDGDMGVEEIRKEFEKDKDNYIDQLNNKDTIIKELERKLQESLENELDTMNISDAVSISDNIHKKEIEELKKELEARPTMEELIELQDNIDEMVRLHNNEAFFKDEEIKRLNADIVKLQTRLERLLDGSSLTRQSDLTSHETNSVVSDLPIYQPDTKVDPSAGKDNWCGLCERDGHNSLNCPYENDIF